MQKFIQIQLADGRTVCRLEPNILPSPEQHTKVIDLLGRPTRSNYSLSVITFEKMHANNNLVNLYVMDDRTESLQESNHKKQEAIVHKEDFSLSDPVVICNDPFLFDGTPMPTRYWLVDRMLNKQIGVLESAGGVNEVEEHLGLVALVDVHERYKQERDRAIDIDHDGPRPSGGVGGTRQGVKCLHTHYAWWLAGGDDPVGAWVHEKLNQLGLQKREKQYL